MLNKKVLVTYGWVRSSLAIMRNLARKGLEVYAGDHQDFFMSKVSRYVVGTMKYPDYKTNPDGFIQSLVDFIVEKKIGTYIPSHEEGLVVAKYRDRFPTWVKIPLPPFEVLDRLHNKLTTFEIAQQCGVPCPATSAFKSLEDYEARKDEIHIPGIFKHYYSHGSHGIGIFRTAEERESHWKRMTAGGVLPLTQEYLERKKIYAATLVAQEGKVYATFVRRNIREKEDFGGACVKCESVHFPELVAHSKKIAEYLKFTGVAMFEFLVNEVTKEHWLMEINPRYWGTSSHEFDCGIEYPWMQYCLLNGISFEENPTYQDGLKSRWIVGDIIAYLKSRKCNKLSGRKLRDFLDFDDNFFMDFKLDDPAPFFVEAYLYFKFRKHILN